MNKKVNPFHCDICKGCKEPFDDPKWGRIKEVKYYIFSKGSYGHHSGMLIPKWCYCSSKCLKKDFFLKITKIHKKFLFFKYLKTQFKWQFKKNPKKRYIVSKKPLQDLKRV